MGIPLITRDGKNIQFFQGKGRIFLGGFCLNSVGFLIAFQLKKSVFRRFLDIFKQFVQGLANFSSFSNICMEKYENLHQKWVQNS
jgi:hypothetical protein